MFFGLHFAYMAGKLVIMRIFRLIVILAVSYMAVSCVGYYETVMRSADVDVKYKGAFHFFNEGKYRKAAEIFEGLTLTMQGLPQEDTVKYYNALSNYNYGDYITAESNFASFLDVFPRSPFAEDAAFLRIKCLYEGTYRYELDQTPTYRAMTIVNEFLFENPDSKYAQECRDMLDEFQERLDRKSYESAKLYYTMEDYLAAHYALKNVLRENAENRYRSEILYYTALSSYKYALNSVPEKQHERYLSFIDDYYNYIGEYPDSPYRKELDRYYQDALLFTKVIGEVDPGTLTKQELRAKKKEQRFIEKEIRKSEKLMKNAKKESDNIDGQMESIENKVDRIEDKINKEN